MKNLSEKAKAIAEKLQVEGEEFLRFGCDVEALRDFCDFETGGSLDCFELDLLTDRVLANCNSCVG